MSSTRRDLSRMFVELALIRLDFWEKAVYASQAQTAQAATCYGSMNGWAADLISQEVADRVGKCWGLGSGTTKDPGPWEGEERNMWKPTQREALWFHGGNLHQSRHYSQFMALQLKARQVGLGHGADASPQLGACPSIALVARPTRLVRSRSVYTRTGS